MKKLVDRFLLHLFAWAGTKFFSVIIIDANESGVNTVHFSIDDKHLRKSCVEYLLEEDKQTTEGQTNARV